MRALQWRLEALGVRHAMLSTVLSQDDSPHGPNERLLDLAESIITRARNIELSLLADRGAPPIVHVWPGEHYRVLAALIEEVKPRSVVEIGTFKGTGSLAMLQGIPDGGKLTTVDILPWDQIPETLIKESDFWDGRFEQILCDFGEPKITRKHADLLRGAEIIFIDASKDGVFEKNLIDNFSAIDMTPGTLLIFDDIRQWEMLDIWRGIQHPKLDITSFGHFSGTGIVEWSG